METSPRLVLASGSPRRKELLAQVGLDFAVEVSGVDETLRAGETPRAHTRRLARAKASAVAERRPGEWILGADTTVVIDGKILGKPRDAADAARMLRMIGGRWHVVFTSFCLMNAGDPRSVEETAESRVFFRALTGAEIRWYIASGEPMDKAGAYAVQGIGAALVQRIEGSYTNVVGLPLAETVTALERLGVLRLTGEA